MQIFRSANLTYVKKLKKRQHPSVVSIGNFDGIHKGHQYIFKQLVKLAKAESAHATIICFEPQPKEFFAPEIAPARITPFRDKMLGLKAHGIDQVLCVRFNQKLADFSGSAFIQQVLVDTLNVKHIVIGEDFRFGRDRESDYKLLIDFGKKHDFLIHNMGHYCQQQNRTSSSQIRTLLQQNQFDQACKLLGRPYTLSGRVHHGNKNGRELGFPTVNMPLVVNIPLLGVYVVKIYWQNKVYFGMANIGFRPTVGGTRRLLETHIFNFDQDIYGQHVQIVFLTFIRREQKFQGLDALKAQIKKDQTTAYNWIAKHQNKQKTPTFKTKEGLY